MSPDYRQTFSRQLLTDALPNAVRVYADGSRLALHVHRDLVLHFHLDGPHPTAAHYVTGHLIGATTTLTENLP